MNLATNIDQYNPDYVYLCDPIKNNIMNEGKFVSILYSTDMMTLNGIYLIVRIDDCVCDKYYNKFRCVFNTNAYHAMIEQMKTIEVNLLKKHIVPNKTMQLKINEQLANGNIKAFEDISNKTSCIFLLKISGIWETPQNYGLTYKFISVK